MRRFLVPETRSRRVIVAAAIWASTVLVFALCAGRERLLEHTPFNHYAHLADAWLHGRQDLQGGAPAYAQNNDFAVFEGKTYISFPPFPAVVMLPFVALAGSPERFQDGQLVVWLAGLGPAVLFLVLEKLRRTRRSGRSELEGAALAWLFAFGTVYFFTAVQGTVWFAAHVVGVATLALYVLFALDAERPVVAGVLLACAWTTRPPMMFASILFVAEAWRVAGGDRRAFARRTAAFALPIAASFAIASWSNMTRFHDPSPLAFGHEHLTVAWKQRIDRWGLAGYHYLSKNLGVALTILPWLPAKTEVARAPFVINEHGLALWFTSPFYVWLLWPVRRSSLMWTMVACVAVIAGIDLCYQNSGWRQFGYRFSNDYALFLFVLLAIGDRSLTSLAFRAASTWAMAWNLFGAVSFDRAAFERFYFREGTQSVVYQPD